MTNVWFCSLIYFALLTWLPKSVFALESAPSFTLFGCSSSAPRNTTKSLSASTNKWPPEQPLVINILRIESLPLIRPGWLVALDLIKMNATLSQAFDFRVDAVSLSRGVGTDSSRILGGLINTLSSANVTYEFMVGSDSSSEIVANGQLTPIYNLIQLCVFCRSYELTDKREIYTTLIRNTIRSQDLSRVILALLKILQVEEIATLSMDIQSVVDNVRQIEQGMTSEGKKVQYSGVLEYKNMDEVIATLAKVAPTYIVALFLPLPVPKSICELYKRAGWRADRTLYITGGVFQNQEFWVPHNFDESTRPWNCTVAEMAYALQGSFVVDVRYVNDTTGNLEANNIIGGINGVELNRRFADYAKQLNILPIVPSNTYHLYDLMWSAADALWRTGQRMSAPESNLSLADAFSDNDYRSPARREFSRIFRGETRKTRFFGATGDYKYDRNYDRYTDLNIFQLQINSPSAAPIIKHDSSATLNQVLVGYFNSELGEISIDQSMFKFATPTNEPPGLWLRTLAERNTQAEKSRLVMSVLIAIVVLLVAVAAVAVYLYLKHQERKADTTWLISSENLTRVQLHSNHSASDASFTSIGSLGSVQSTSNTGRASSTFSALILPNRGRARLMPNVAGAAEAELWIRMVNAPSGVVSSATSAKNPILLSRAQKTRLNEQFPEASVLILVQHVNVIRFFGVCFEKKLVDKALLLYEWAPKGTVRRCLANQNFVLDNNLKNSFMHDIASGLQFIHNTKNFGAFGGAHAFLHTDNVVLDSKFTAKLTDYGFWQYRPPEDLESVNKIALEKIPEEKLEALLFRAPELLHNGIQTINFNKRRQTQKSAVVEQIYLFQTSDVYSFGMVMVELFTRHLPYLHEDDYPSRQSLENLVSIVSGISTEKSLRIPLLSPEHLHPHMSHQLVALVTDCGRTVPGTRPIIGEVLRRIRKLPGFSTTSVIESLIDNLEGMVAERTRALADEMAKSEELLAQMLPRTVAEQLKCGNAVPPESFEAVSIYFSDIVAFTALSAESTPMEVVVMLNDLYTLFDAVLGNFDVYKVETIGDAYMVASGLPIRNGNRHLSEIAHLSLTVLEATGSFVIAHRPEQQLSLRIGLHTGPCVAGVVGIKMPRYCLFGDTINMASRMESTGKPRKIHLSEDFDKHLQAEFGKTFVTRKRGEVLVKGKGTLNTAWLLRANREEEPAAEMMSY